MIRPMRVDERNFVLANWLRSYARSEFALMSTPKDAEHAPRCTGCGLRRVLAVQDQDGRVRPQAGPAYWRGHRGVVERLMASCNVSVLENDEDGMLDGFIVRDPSRPVLHYLYVRQSSRGRGVARALVADLRANAVSYTHRTGMLEPSKIPRGWHFDLYGAFA